MVAEQMLKDGPNPDQRVLERLAKIDQSVNRIANIVKGLRTFARSDDAQISYFNILEPLQEIFDMLKDIYHKEGVRLGLQTDGTVNFILGNRGRIQQVLINLISNAKDSTEEKTERLVTINVSSVSNEVIIKVTDNGSGIKEDLKEKIFEPFFTTKDPNKGTGIGLSLVNNIIKEHKGRIDLETKLGHGSTFTLILPKKKQTSVAVAPSLEDELIHRLPIKIMVVEDEEDLRDIMYNILSRICDQVVMWDSAEKALIYLENHSVDVILSDIKMPKIDGFEFFRIVKKLPLKNQPAFVFISGGIEMNSEQEKIVTNQANGFWTKPFKRDDIQQKLQALLKKS